MKTNPWTHHRFRRLATLIFGPAIGPSDPDTGAENMAYRLFELGIAAVYAAAATFVLEAFRPATPPTTP